MPSLPARGEWIEIDLSEQPPALPLSLPARGEWIEMNGSAAPVQLTQSLPARGEWIEIPRRSVSRCRSPSLPAQGEWIEIGVGQQVKKKEKCLSPHGESGLKSDRILRRMDDAVSPRTGRVD